MFYILIICIIALIITIVAKIRESRSEDTYMNSYSRNSYDSTLRVLNEPIEYENTIVEDKIAKGEKNSIASKRMGLDNLEDSNENLYNNSVVDEDLKQKIRELKNSGKIIHAIKILRDSTKMSLADAKNYVEKL